MGTHVLEVGKPEIHHFCATVTALDTIPNLSIAPDFISGELMFAADYVSLKVELSS